MRIAASFKPLADITAERFRKISTESGCAAKALRWEAVVSIKFGSGRAGNRIFGFINA
jgi:hypothetical protein